MNTRLAHTWVLADERHDSMPSAGRARTIYRKRIRGKPAQPVLVAGLDGLAVQRGGGGIGLTAAGLADLHARGTVDALLKALLNPEAKDPVNGAPTAAVYGQLSPGAAGSKQMEKAVDHQAPVAGRSPDSRAPGE